MILAKSIPAKKYDYVYGLNSDNLYCVEKNDKKGLCNASGVEVVHPVYDYIYSVDDGVIKVEKGDKKGLIDANTFKVLLPCEYTYIYSKNGRTIKVEKGDKNSVCTQCKGFKDVCAASDATIYKNLNA